MILTILSALIIVTPSTTAYFWSNSPTSWGYDDDPAQIPATPDGSGSAIILAGDGVCDADLTGGTEQSPSSVYYTDTYRDNGCSLMFCVDYDIEARMKDTFEDTWCIVNLTYFIDNEGWQYGDSMNADVQTCYPAIEVNTDDGWLYVYIDTDYKDEPQIKLTLYTYTKYWDQDHWENYGNSPQIANVYFHVIDQTT